ncbi:chromate resistance protein ChrB domain-containing protein [Streptomyces marispadix]|uniref:chromate resistance protein ChrB domain-containing protein n=1 Tax=Streptomyces marispadix TaxID=2922868 RepID=UPI0035562155
MRGVELGHHGDDCSFETILRRYRLMDPVLWRLAEIVHEADLPGPLLRAAHPLRRCRRRQSGTAGAPTPRPQHCSPDRRRHHGRSPPDDLQAALERPADPRSLRRTGSGGRSSHDPHVNHAIGVVVQPIGVALEFGP